METLQGSKNKMKPLTIEQLKSLEVGDWVWITTPTNSGEYYQIGYSDYLENENVFVAYSLHYELNVLYCDYGTKWLAYKNKEQAECKGEIVELPCLRDIEDFIENDGTRVRMKELNYMERGRIYSIPYVEGQFEEAERRLAELTKE